jgi:hypothetical protein
MKIERYLKCNEAFPQHFKIFNFQFAFFNILNFPGQRRASYGQLQSHHPRRQPDTGPAAQVFAEPNVGG